MLPAEDALPVALTVGWPEPLPGSRVILREIGGTLGTLHLGDDEWTTLRSSPVYSVRIDDHTATHEWTATEPDGTVTHREAEIPTSPVLVPPNVLNALDLMMWVFTTHGALGRLLWWDDRCTWWIVEEPDLELMLLCAPAGLFRDESDLLSWWEIGTDDARREVNELCARYDLDQP
jgi:hypothetical protein